MNNVSDVSRGMIFIPDISGFTKFVNDTEIKHSQHIIKELIEILIDANILNLQISEIEGDAILFYRLGQAPVAGEIADQARKMFLAFHQHLRAIERDRVCHCGACSTAGDLTLKFFVHYGDISISRIKHHEKLMGASVILAHRLMKNEIEGQEYVLMTRDYLESQSDEKYISCFNWDQLKAGSIVYEHIGEVTYQYIMLSALHAEVRELVPYNPPQKFSDPIVIDIFIAAPMSLVYNVITDLGLRVEWTDGLKDIEYDNSEILRIGAKHVCDLPAGQVELETIYGKRQKDVIEYAERATRDGMLKNVTSHFILTDSCDGTGVKMEFHYQKRKVIGRLIDLIMRKKITEGLRHSATLLKSLCERLYQKAASQVTNEKAMM